MKKIKRVLAAVSAAAMCTGMLVEVPYCTTNITNELLVYAAGEEQQTSGVCGESLTWTLDSNGVLAISGSGDMTNWTESPKVPWYGHREIIKGITIADGVTSIGKFAFCSLRNAESVKIPESVTTIGGGAFAMCSKLPDIKLHAGISEIGSTAFRLCTGMKAITIENPECVIGDSAETFPAKAVIHGYSNSTAQAYAEKYEREFVALDDEKTPVEIVDSGECGVEGDNVTWEIDSEGTLTISGSGDMINYDFEEDAPWYREYYQEGGVTKVIIEDGVTSIGDMAFNDCVYLTSITIPDSVTSIGFRAFYWTALDSITIPDSVTTVGDEAFMGCSELATITIPDSVTAIGENAFDETPWLESKIAENPLVTVNNILIDGTACKGEITIPENITHIVVSAFSESKELTAINVAENNQNYTSENGVLFNKDKTTLVSYPMGNTAKEYTIPAGVVNIEDEAFFRCENLTSVIIPDGVKNIGNSAFYWCNGLLSVDISDTVESIGEYAFNNCNDLTSIKIPDSVTSLGMEAVSSCYSLKTVEIGNGITEIKDYTFKGCDNLTSVKIGNNVESIGKSAFWGCDKLESISIPDSVINIGESAFKHCSALSSVEIPVSVEKIEAYAFDSCDGLKSITIYNPECEIAENMYDTLYSESEIAAIYGYSNSTAQAYAEKYNRKFVVLSDEAENLSFGDINSDGVVDSSDASLILVEYAVSLTGGTSAFTAEQKKAIDINGDSICDASDASLVLAYYSYISTGGKDSIEEFIADKNDL